MVMMSDSAKSKARAHDFVNELLESIDALEAVVVAHGEANDSDGVVGVDGRTETGSESSLCGITPMPIDTPCQSPSFTLVQLGQRGRSQHAGNSNSPLRGIQRRRIHFHSACHLREYAASRKRWDDLQIA